jgi:hypothetical protein
MLSQMKWARFATTVLVALALLYASAMAKKPPKDPPPEPDPPPVLIAYHSFCKRCISRPGAVSACIGCGK